MSLCRSESLAETRLASSVGRKHAEVNQNRDVRAEQSRHSFATIRQKRAESGGEASRRFGLWSIVDVV
jgi:hypothetical protein